jgi:predicted RNase H-like HicB family nuclease
MDYTIVIRKAESGCYIASCPVIPECHAQGNSYEEAIQNAKEALSLCIEYMREQGQELFQEMGSVKVAVRA